MFEFITRVAEILDGKYAVAVSNYDRTAHYFTELGYPLSMVPKRYTDEPRVRVAEDDLIDVRRLISTNLDTNFFIGTVNGLAITRTLEKDPKYERFAPLKDKLVFVENPYHVYHNVIRIGRNNQEGLDMVPVLIEYLDKTSPGYIERLAMIGYEDYKRINNNPQNPRELRQIKAFENKQRLLDIAQEYRNNYLGSSDAHVAFVEYLKTSGVLPE